MRIHVLWKKNQLTQTESRGNGSVSSSRISIVVDFCAFRTIVSSGQYDVVCRIEHD